MINFKLFSFLKLKYEKTNVDWNVFEIQTQSYSMNAIEKNDIKVNISIVKNKNNSI